jgi:hypothetical protein
MSCSMKREGRFEMNFSAPIKLSHFSLTPALSRWERENRFPIHGKTTAGFCSANKLISEGNQRLFPLPAGEGQGEGERTHKI